MRQFILTKSPDKNGFFEISGKDFRYLKNVLRIETGDEIPIRFPDGNLLIATVHKINTNEKKIILKTCETSDSKKTNLPDFKPGTEFWLFQFVAKNQKMNSIIRQATECGISKIIPIFGKFSQIESGESNLKIERFKRIIKEARQQSGSAIETSISKMISVREACEMWLEDTKNRNDALACVLREHSEQNNQIEDPRSADCAYASKSIYQAHSIIGKYESIKKCAVVCGSEGGISSSEIQIFENAGFVSVHFETNILRCETAALYGIAVLQNLIAEKNTWQLKE